MEIRTEDHKNRGIEVRDQKKEVIRKGLFVWLAVSALALTIFINDNCKMLPVDENGNSTVDRNKSGGGEKEQELEAVIGKDKEKVTVKVREQKLTKAEIEKQFEEAEEVLKELALGKNESPDEVRSDLNLASELPDSGIRVSWELDNYEVINLQGELQEEMLPDTGTLVKLTAYLTYEEEKEQVSFYVCLYPPKQSHHEQLLSKLKQQIERAEEETREKETMPLPDQVDGIPVYWKYVKDFRGVGLLALGAVLPGILYLAEEQKAKEKVRKREKQMMMDYPLVVSKFTLYLSAGMTPRKAWFTIVEAYEKQKMQTGERAVYEEMAAVMHEIQGGNSEADAYEHFGDRCGLSVYRKFAMQLSQNLKKGTKGLTVILRQEADNAFEERKSMAKKSGEEAGTKMLFPMFLMLAVVLLMLIVPAFFSIQI